MYCSCRLTYSFFDSLGVLFILVSIRNLSASPSCSTSSSEIKCVLETTSRSVDVISVVVANVASSLRSSTPGIGAVTTRVEVTFLVTTNAEAVLRFVKTNVAAAVVGATVGSGVVAVDVSEVVVVVSVVLFLNAVVVVERVDVLERGVRDTVVLMVSRPFEIVDVKIDEVVMTGLGDVTDLNWGMIVCLRRLRF